MNNGIWIKSALILAAAASLSSCAYMRNLTGGGAGGWAAQPNYGQQYAQGPYAGGNYQQGGYPGGYPSADPNAQAGGAYGQVYDPYAAGQAAPGAYDPNRAYDPNQTYAPAANPAPGAPAAPALGGVYEVRSGDTVYSIARQFGVSQNDIARWNNLPSLDRISIGQKLIVSGAGAGASPRERVANDVQPAARTGSRTVDGVTWSWPVSGRASGVNGGYDIAGTRGEHVYAAADGVVEWADGNSGKPGVVSLGRSVMVQSGPTYLAVYSRLQSVSVKHGQKIKRGQVVGRMGGRDGKPLLHFQIRKNGQKSPPGNYLPRP